MTGREVRALAAAVMLLGGCAADQDPAPAIDGQAAADDGGSDDGTERSVVGTQVQQGAVTSLGEVRVGVYSIVTGTLAQLSIDTPDEVIESTELRVGDEIEVGGYTITLTGTGSSSARVLVVDPDGNEVVR